LFRRAIVHLENGKDVVINAHENGPRNVYVQSLRVNGKPYHKTYLRHDVLAAGAVLDFQMGPEPSAWGGDADAVPPSITEGDEVPLPLHDITGSRTGVASWSGGGDPGPVFDDNGHETTFRARTPWVRYSLRDSRATVLRYTLSSGSRAGDPTGWVLEGSNDAIAWTVLDRRVNQEFRWRRQTRAFTVAEPGEYAHYRLRVIASTAEHRLTLGGIEFLAR
jgi:hypothetical protein